MPIYVCAIVFPRTCCVTWWIFCVVYNTMRTADTTSQHDSYILVVQVEKQCCILLPLDEYKMLCSACHCMLLIPYPAIAASLMLIPYLLCRVVESDDSKIIFLKFLSIFFLSKFQDIMYIANGGIHISVNISDPLLLRTYIFSRSERLACCLVLL